MITIKILIISDNHGEQGISYDVYGRNTGDLNIHLGDSEFHYDDTEMSHFNRVKGNVDGDTRYPIEEYNAEAKTFYTHGHYYDIKNNRQMLAERAKEYDAKYAFYGHSHVAKAESVNGVYCINPGSISQSKGEWPESYAVLDTETDVVTFLDRSHQILGEVDLTKL
ncbi:YfcE family phosphodiesterase [Salinicoccus sp. HZC-1]|uniref:YfcE family phosphodiesterase n=1 Tax=Salinicoccus sp. HZC-1 TaxID=3385497 RepID=UPI00398A9436